MSDQPAPAPRRQRADQDRALANRINQYRTALIAAQGNAELIELLAGRGYDASGQQPAASGWRYAIRVKLPHLLVDSMANRVYAGE